jgi:hypothetical protein
MDQSTTFAGQTTTVGSDQCENKKVALHRSHTAEKQTYVLEVFSYNAKKDRIQRGRGREKTNLPARESSDDHEHKSKRRHQTGHDGSIFHWSSAPPIRLRI